MLRAAMPAAVTGKQVDVLNFVVTGDTRSGAGIIQSSLHGSPKVACHADLFNPRESVRRQSHCDYFGVPADPDAPPVWFMPDANPYQYLSHQIFDAAINGESAVGLRLLYPQIQKYELYELFAERSRQGSFCVIHVVRNPVSCFISYQQAKRTKIWSISPNEPLPRTVPPAVSVDPEQLIRHVHNHCALQAKIDRSASDMLIVRYTDLYTDFEKTMRQVHEFLEEPTQHPAPTTRRRLRNRTMRERIANFDTLYRQVPRDIREFLDNDLF